MLPCSLSAVVTASAGERPVDRTDELADGTRIACFAERPAPGDAILFGLSDRGAALRRRDPGRLRGRGRRGRPALPAVALGGVDGRRVGGVRAGARARRHRRLQPARRRRHARPGRARRVRRVGPPGGLAALHAGRPRSRFYRRSPFLRSASAFTVGGTIPAVHAETVRDEILGIVRGRRRAAVPARPRAGARRRPSRSSSRSPAGSGHDGWRAWERVEHFDASAATDRHFRLDAATGEIVFGPGVRQLDGTLRQYGAVPRHRRADARHGLPGRRREPGQRGGRGDHHAAHLGAVRGHPGRQPQARDRRRRRRGRRGGQAAGAGVPADAAAGGHRRPTTSTSPPPPTRGRRAPAAWRGRARSRR